MKKLCPFRRFEFLSFYLLWVTFDIHKKDSRKYIYICIDKRLFPRIFNFILHLTIPIAMESRKDVAYTSCKERKVSSFQRVSRINNYSY